MKKKFICTVCGYIYEGEEAPDQCPVCKAPKSKFKELEDNADEDFSFATVHYLGAAYKEGVSEELIKHCKDTFAGEC
ncbi:MAG TPA: reverse rubrerythrin, partial [Prevotella sp.]|nr:reverse rubrerythrin [Prevotella sp.]